MPSTYPFQTSQLYLLLFLPDLLENFNYKMSSIPEENAFEVLFFVEFLAIYIKTESVNRTLIYLKWAALFDVL